MAGLLSGIVRAAVVVKCACGTKYYNPSVSFADSSLYTREPKGTRIATGCALAMTGVMSAARCRERREQAPALRLASGVVGTPNSFPTSGAARHLLPREKVRRAARALPLRERAGRIVFFILPCPSVPWQGNLPPALRIRHPAQKSRLVFVQDDEARTQNRPGGMLRGGFARGQIIQTGWRRRCR